MPTTSILLWYNENNPKSVEFAEGFKEDLQKCLVRFRSTFTIRVNAEKEESDYCILTLSSADISDEQFINRAKNLLSNPQTAIISIDPFDTSSTEIVKLKQPFIFWDKRFETGEYRFFRRNTPELLSNYWEKVTDIVVDIHEKQSKTTSTQKKEFVYLSQDDISHNVDRENLKRDLNDLGYEVLPDKPFSIDFNECTEQIKHALHDSKLIIHIIPPIYSIHFPDHHLSLTEHQCNVSANHLKNNETKAIRIIWISSSYEISDEENQVFVEKIQRDQDQTLNSTVLKSSIEDLKKYYRHLLTNLPEEKEKNDENIDVYVIADSTSNGIVNEIGKLVSGKLTVGSNFSGITYNQHLKNLAKARFAILCYTSANEQWLAVKVNDIQKSIGIDSAVPLEKVILLKGSQDLDTSRFENVFTNVVTNVDEFSKLHLTE